MSATTATVKGLLRVFDAAYRNVVRSRFVMGDVYNNLCDILPTTAEVVRTLRDAYPNAKMEIGWALTPANLQALGLASRTFRESGIASRDGKHMVTRDDMLALNLTPSEIGTISERVASGAMRVKDVAEVVQAVSKATDENGNVSDVGARAVARLRGVITDAPVPMTVEELEVEIARIGKRIAKDTAARADLLAKVAELRHAALAPIPATEADIASVMTARPRANGRVRVERPVQVSAS